MYTYKNYIAAATLRLRSSVI